MKLLSGSGGGGGGGFEEEGVDVDEYFRDLVGKKFRNPRNGWANMVVQIDSSAGYVKVDFSHHGLSRIPENIFIFLNLRILKLNYNNIKGIEGAKIAKLTRLEIVDLSNNNITELPNELALLPCLEKLDVSCNKLSTIPSSFYRLFTPGGKYHGYKRKLWFQGNPDMEPTLEHFNSCENLPGLCEQLQDRAERETKEEEIRKENMRISRQREKEMRKAQKHEEKHTRRLDKKDWDKMIKRDRVTKMMEHEETVAG